MKSPESFYNLSEAKNNKIDTLSEKTFSNENLSSSSYTAVDNGYIENNGNKIWGISEDWTPQENAFARDYIFNNFSRDVEDRNDRRAYEYGVKEEGKYVNPNQPYQPEDYDPVKVGLASGRLPSSDYRYQPGRAEEEGLADIPYGWESGDRGVDVADNRFDKNLDRTAATAFEALMHSNKNNMANRLVRQREDGLYDYASPEGLIVIDKEQKDALFGSGASEYYSSNSRLFDDSYDEAAIDREKVIRGINEAMGIVSGDGLVSTNAEMQRRAGELADKYTSFVDRAANTAKGFGAAFVDSLIISPIDAVGDLTGWYDIGTEEENTKAVNDFFGYDDRFMQRAMDRVGTQWEKVADENASIGERIKAAGNGIIEAAITPELWGTSFGALISWITPGAALKAIGVGSKYANTVKRIDDLVSAGKLTSAAARTKKAKAFLSIPGAKNTLAKQSGYIVSAFGATNNQYNQFVENNNGIELEGAEKVKWFAGRFAVQLVNQNLDKIVDFSIMKNPGVIAAAIPAVKAMTNKEFANVVKMMGKGVAVTGTNMGKEAAQEYSQTMMELFNSRYGSEQFKDADSFVDFVTDERNTTEAGIAALAGAGGSVQFETVGSVAPAAAFGAELAKKGISSVTDKIKKDKPAEQTTFESTVDENEITEEEAEANTVKAQSTANSVVKKYAGMLNEEEFTKVYASDETDEDLVDTPNFKAELAKNPEAYKSSIEEIERAEAVFQDKVDAGKEEEKDEIAFKVLRKAKRQIYSNLMEEESHPDLGSGYTPEDVVVDYLDTVDLKDDGSLDLSEEEEAKLKKYAEDNDIPEFRFKELRKFRTDSKDAFAVQQDIFGDDPRSAVTYRKQLRKLVNSANPSRKAIAKVIDANDNFLNTQLNRKEAYNAVYNKLEADVKRFNSLVKSGKKLPNAVKSTLLKGKDIPGYEGSYVSVSRDGDLLKISDDSTAIKNSIQDNINFLQRTKDQYGAKANKILGEDFITSSVEGISVRPNSAKQEARDKDKAFYEKRGITKAIVDTKASDQWSSKGDYYRDNESKVNTGTYTADDVVVINSTARGFAKGSRIRKEIEKAYKAGATIVIDREVTGNKAANNGNYLHRLLDNYHFEKVVEDGVTKYLPTAKAKELVEKQTKAEEEKAAKNKRYQDLIVGIETGDQKLVDQAADLFGGDKTKIKAYYENRVAKESEELSKMFIETAIDKGYRSPELNAVQLDSIKKSKTGILTSAAVSKAFDAVNDKIEQLQEGETLLTDWNEAVKQAKKGEVDLDRWVKEHVEEPAGVIKRMFNNALGKDEAPTYAYYNNKHGFIVTDTLKKVPRNAVYQVIELDPNNYTAVRKVTPLNSLEARELLVKGKDNIAFNELVSSALKTLKDTINRPDNSEKSYDLVNSPVASLIFDKDGNANENAAVALKIALNGFIKNSAYLLKKGKKSKADISEILGIDESQISREAVAMMADKGLLYKTAANSVGKDVASMLGLSAKSNSEADAQAYDALVADLGQTALLMGVTEGILETDNSLMAAKFAQVVLNKPAEVVDDGNNAKVIFIQAVEGKEEELERISELAKEIEKVIPDVNASRKEPKFERISDKRKKAVTGKIRKEKLGLGIAEDSKKALNELMDTEWSVDTELINEMIKDKELIKERLGYIDTESDKYKKLSFEEKEVQESINRGLDKSFEEMEWLIENGSTSLWFEYFFSKNGRFFIDSNTINPQTDKHLHRFTIQPKTHTNTYIFKDGKFTADGKDVTENVYYAISQGFGFKTDKEDTKKINDYSSKVLAKLNTVKKIKKARKKLLKTGEVESLGIKIEHLGHALQTFKFLEKLVESNGKPFDSAITAEFDAVTSGFGLKLLQMPIVGNEDVSLNEWLKKVGIVFESDESITTLENVSMNDMLDSGNVQDSYQTLASRVKQLSFKDMLSEIPNTDKEPVVVDNEYNNNLWNALTDPEVLPQVSEDGSVGSALRSLFKYPFMTFNYSASIKSIRKNLLTGELLSELAKKMAAADISDNNDPVVKLMRAYIGKKGSLVKLQEEIRTIPLSRIRGVTKGAGTLEQQLGQMIEASYGAQVESVLTKQFKDFVDAQEKVNNAFKAMFEIFSASFDKEIEKARKDGAVSAKKEKAIYDKLKNQWPMIRGPLSAMEEDLSAGDGIGIYDTQTSSPYGKQAGRKPVRANLSKKLQKQLGQKDIRVSHMIKQMAAAIAAGSVIPIHYIDGAVMGQTINSLAADGVKGITSIHDAIMPSLVNMAEAQKAYNKQVIDVNANYSFIEEIMKSLDRFLDEVPLTEKIYQDREVKVDDTVKSVRDFIMDARNDFMGLANKVGDARLELYSALNKGARAMHMAGTSDGVYNVTEGTIDYKQVDKRKKRRYNDKKVKGVSLTELNTKTQNIC